MRSLTNNILKIKKIKRKIRSLRRRKIKNLREINSKTTILKSNKNLLLLKLNVKIVNKKHYKNSFNCLNYVASNEIRNRDFNKKKFDIYRYNIKYIIY